MDTTLRDEILARLDQMSAARQRRVLEVVRRIGGTPPGTPGKGLLDLASTLSPEEAAAMADEIENAFEQAARVVRPF